MTSETILEKVKSYIEGAMVGIDESIDTLSCMKGEAEDVTDKLRELHAQYDTMLEVKDYIENLESKPLELRLKEDMNGR